MQEINRKPRISKKSLLLIPVPDSETPESPEPSPFLPSRICQPGFTYTPLRRERKGKRFDNFSQQLSLQILKCEENKGDRSIDTMTPFTPPESIIELKEAFTDESNEGEELEEEKKGEAEGLTPGTPLEKKFLREKLSKYISRLGTAMELPPSDNQCTVVLDLDETLIKTLTSTNAVKTAITIQLAGLSVTKEGIYFVKRPYLDDFLNQISNKADIVIYTSSKPGYAATICETLQLHADVKFTAIMSYFNCHALGKKGILKDLKLILNRKTKNIIILDDSIKVWQFSKEKVLQIVKYKGSPTDNSLKWAYEKIDDFLRNNKRATLSKFSNK